MCAGLTSASVGVIAIPPTGAPKTPNPVELDRSPLCISDALIEMHKSLKKSIATAVMMAILLMTDPSAAPISPLAGALAGIQLLPLCPIVSNNPLSSTAPNNSLIAIIAGNTDLILVSGLRQGPFFTIILIYIQIGCTILGALSAMFNGMLVINLVVALFTLVKIDGSSQNLGRAYAVLLACSIFLMSPGLYSSRT